MVDQGLTEPYLAVLLVYLAFTLAATLLALLRRFLRPHGGGESVWRKYPTYILINLGFLTASWLPTSWHILTILLSLLGGAAAWELTRSLLGNEKRWLILLPCMTTLLIAAAESLEPGAWTRIWLFGFLVLMIISSLGKTPAGYGKQVIALAGSMVYLPVCLVTILWLKQVDSTGFQAVFLYLIVATNDALAQITGQLFGKRPLAPAISPAKTVEGAVGGLLFAGGMGLALGIVLNWNVAFTTLLGLIVGLSGLAGDLTESAWKRALGLRNFSALLGAQGGVLDRFDGLILAAPIYYLVTVWFWH